MSERDHGEGENVVRLPTEFRFEESPVRAVMYNDEPWFIAKDVCDILDIDDPSKAVSRIDDDERGTTTVRTAGGPQEMLTLNESGVYSLVFTSRKPEAKRFRKWVTSEVPPEIRKTGGYRRPETQFAGLSGERVEWTLPWGVESSSGRKEEHFMGKPQRRFGKEFAAEAVRLVEVSGRTQREIARDLGVGLTLRRRLDKRREHEIGEAPAARTAGGPGG